MDLVAQLDKEVNELRAHALAPSTKRTYSTYLQQYLTFCQVHHLPALPATTRNICRYIAFLSRTKVPNSIPQYLTVIRLLHLQLDLPHPFKENHTVDYLIKAVKRHKAKEVHYKMTLTTDDLRAMKPFLALHKPADAQLWSLLLTCYFALLRISNVTVPSKNCWDQAKIISREDIQFHASGCVLTIRWAKNLQLRDRTFQAAIPRLDNDICPTAALLNLLRVAGPLPPCAPAWAITLPGGGVDPPTPSTIRPRLQSLIAAIGKPPSEYNTHSLRRSGASHLLSLGVPLEAIKVLGDWKSDSVFRYLKPQSSQRLSMVNNIFKK